MSGEDPRKNPVEVATVPRLLREGAALYNAGEFWLAHEAWETAWHSLRAEQRSDEAAYLRGMILITSAFENARRGKESGHKRQSAEGLHALLSHPQSARALNINDPRGWESELVAVYVDACRRVKWSVWNESGWKAPALSFFEEGGTDASD